jgi:hypothetical protein
MQKLHRIDLSGNRLEQLDNRIFELNEELQEIDLSKNKFMTIHDSPFIISDSLEVSRKSCSIWEYIFVALGCWISVSDLPATCITYYNVAGKNPAIFETRLNSNATTYLAKNHKFFKKSLHALTSGNEVKKAGSYVAFIFI